MWKCDSTSPSSNIFKEMFAKIFSIDISLIRTGKHSNLSRICNIGSQRVGGDGAREFHKE